MHDWGAFHASCASTHVFALPRAGTERCPEKVPTDRFPALQLVLALSTTVEIDVTTMVKCCGLVTVNVIGRLRPG